MKHALGTLAAISIATITLSGCMMKSTHEEILTGMKKEADDLLSKETEVRKQCEEKLKVEIADKNKLSAEVTARGMQINKLLNEKGALAEERQQLSTEQQKLAQQIEELERMKAAAEKRSAEYRTLLQKLHKMIDAGTLQVKVRNGRMLVQMASDVVFPSGSTHIKPEAREAISELASTISSFSDRKFQVLGHSDSTPINTTRFPSNWELSTQRAIEVVKLMIEAGVPPEMLSAAGSAEFDSLVDNDKPENRAVNRRVEIIFMPSIDELPGFEQVMSK